MTIIENVPNSLLPYLVGLIPMIAYLIKVTIDNWGATDLEKIRMSNLKKFQISFTKYAALGLFFLAISYLIVISSNKFTGENMKNSSVYAIVIICSIIFSASMFLFEKLLGFIGKILIFQYDYYIVDKDGNLMYRIIKPSINNTLLVEASGIQEFIDANEKLRYKIMRRENKALLKFYNSKWTFCLICSLVVTDVVLITLVFLTSSWWQFVFYLIFIIICIITMILLMNYVLNKKVSRSSN